MSDAFYEKTVNQKHIYQGNIIDLDVDDVRLPNGHYSKRELVHHSGAVAVIAVTAEGKVVCVRQFRKPLEKTTVEIPAGKLEPGEDPTTCAYRELAEETGYRADDLQYVTSFYASPGFCDECLHVYVTNQLTAGHRSLDDDEFVESVELSLLEAASLMREQQICDAKTMYAIQYLQLQNLHKEG